MSDRPLHDNEMPRDWHQIKCALLDELVTAASYDLCRRCADALFHARLLGEGVARADAEDRSLGMAERPTILGQAVRLTALDRIAEGHDGTP